MTHSLLTKPLATTVSVAKYVYGHPANRDRRIRALARAIVFQARGRTGRKTKVRIGTGGRMWAVLHYSASSKVAYANPPDWNEMQVWRRWLKPGDTFVDVGSNVGTYSLFAADLGATVAAVEPGRRALELLRENVALNPTMAITMFDCALGSKYGSMRMTEDEDTTNHLIGYGCDGGTLVEVRTFDDVAPQGDIAGVKIDVEGAERLVLEGAKDSLSRGRVKILQLEWNPLSESVLGERRDPCSQILREAGYSFFRPDDTGRLHPANSAGYGEDIFAVHRSVSDQESIFTGADHSYRVVITP